MSGKRAKAPCNHDGEHIIGNYVKCLAGCDAVAKAQEAPILRRATNFGEQATQALADLYSQRDAMRRVYGGLMSQQQAVVNGGSPTPPIGVPAPPPPTHPCRMCKSPAPFIRLSLPSGKWAIYECSICVVHRGRIRRPLQTQVRQ